MEISREIFDQQRRPRFGNANPERMTFAFWEWMIRGEGVPSVNGEGSLQERGFRLRDGKLKSAYGPYRARDLFNIPLNLDDGPIWTFDRMGATRTPLVDGRLINIGGGHEDFYDPDFFIYNDVVVFGPQDRIEIYGYPKQVFPPTDFHSASVIDGRVVIIGGLGYKDERCPGRTPVYELDLSEYRISEIRTSGEMPGWISEHEASYEPTGTITIRGGRIVPKKGARRLRRNFEDYSLDLKSFVWRRLTNRNWHEFSVWQEKGAFVLEQRPQPEALLPRGAKHLVMPDRRNEGARFLVADVPVSLTIHVTHVEVVIEGNLAEPLLEQLAEEIRANCEAAVKRRCFMSHM